MSNILILGGTGAMGEHLVHLLGQDSGNHIYVTSRTVHKNQANVSYHVGNAHDDVFLFPLLKMQPWDVIVDFMAYSTVDFYNRVGVLLESTKQYMFLSSSRVYASQESPIREDSMRLLDVSHDSIYLKTDEYALAKARQEDILRKSGKNNWTIIRPYITYSESRLQLGVLEKEAWLYLALKGRTIVFSRDVLEKRTTLTYGYDVARSIVALIGCHEAYSQAFHITVTESHTWGEILNLYLDVIERYTGKKAKLLILDKHPYQRDNRPFYQLIYDRYFNRTFDNTKIGKFVDVETFTPTMDGLTKCLEVFIVKQNFRNINWKEEAGRDRITKECAKMGEFPSVKIMIKYFLCRFVSFLR